MKRVKHVGLALIVATVAWGCNENNSNQPQQNFQEQREQSPRPEQVQTPQQQATPATGKPDAYGREPGHAHYGHDHPRQDLNQGNQVQQGSPTMQTSPMQNSPMLQTSPQQTQPAPTTGGTDKYGRKPGDAHYGHDHPLLDEEKK